MVQKELKDGTSPLSTASFFYIKPTKKSLLKNTHEKRILNTDIWNNAEVCQQTGYSIELVKDCLVELSRFIEEYLEPNKLRYFNVAALSHIHNYN